MSEIVVVDDLSFEVRRSDRRTTVGLTIDRGGELVLSVPSDCPTETARQIAGDKRLWIYTKLAQRERLSRPLAAREFVTGEGFSYLGRTYRLKLIDPASAVEPPLRLQHGRFLLVRTERQRRQEHFVQQQDGRQQHPDGRRDDGTLHDGIGQQAGDDRDPELGRAADADAHHLAGQQVAGPHGRQQHLGHARRLFLSHAAGDGRAVDPQAQVQQGQAGG
jgi:Protein of unknown function DUF45